MSIMQFSSSKVSRSSCTVHLWPPPLEKPPNEPPPVRKPPPLLWLLRQFWYSCEASPKVLRVSLQSAAAAAAAAAKQQQHQDDDEDPEEDLDEQRAPLNVVGSASRWSAARCAGARRKAPITASALSVSPADQTTSCGALALGLLAVQAPVDAAPVPT